MTAQSPDTPRGLEELAGKLTEAERRAVAKREPVSWGTKMTASLVGMGIGVLDDWDIPTLSPLGLALRAHIQGNDNG